MKRLLALFVIFSIPVFSQVKNPVVYPSSLTNTWDFFYTVNDTNGSPYADSTCRSRSFNVNLMDTLQGVFVVGVSSVYFNVAVSETSTVLIDYATSEDGWYWSDFAVKDSLSYRADGYGQKSVDFTSVVLGKAFVRFRLRASALAYALGTTNPLFWASYTLKQ